MINKYLNKNPIPWLLEDSNPVIKYLTLRDIVEDSGIDQYYSHLLDSQKLINKLKIDKNGILGNSKNFDLYYKGTMWCFAEAIESGLTTRTPSVNNTAKFILDNYQMQSGGFTLNWSPAQEVACRTGDMIRYLIKSGFKDNRIYKGLQWIVEHQREDDGWLHCPISGICDQIKLIMFNKSGKGLAREKNNSAKSCIFATAACSMALAEYKHATGSDEFARSIEKAAQFFLRKSMFIDSTGDIARTQCHWNSNIELLGYPVLSQFDILYGLTFTAMAGFTADNRTGKAFNVLMSRQNDDGTWNYENGETGMLFDKSEKSIIGKKSKWTTLRIIRFLKYTEALI